MKKIAVLFLAVVALSGCAGPMYNQYPMDPQAQYAQNVRQNATMGALTGIGPGAVLGLVLGGRSGALVGAGIGAAVGAGAYAASTPRPVPVPVYHQVLPTHGDTYGAAYEEEMRRLQEREFFRRQEAERHRAINDARQDFFREETLLE
jgi:hypothetical protein